MDTAQFDTLVKSFAHAETRRRLLCLAANLTLGGALAALLGDDPAASAKDDDHGSSGRRQRRKARHRHQTGNNKESRKGERKGRRKRKGKNTDRQPDPAPIPGCSPNPDAQTCAGQCGAIENNCGTTVNCPACPEITSFTATLSRIDRIATPPESATLVWSTSNATSCSLDDGAGPVSVDCNGNTSVGPAASTTYTLSASGAGGGPVQEQLSIEVEYCYPFTFTGTSGMSCPSGASEFCLTEPIVATSSAHAEEACRTCSANTCFQAGICDGAAHVGSGGLFFYADVTSAACGSGDLPRAGENWNGNRTVRFGHWAPVPTP